MKTKLFALLAIGMLALGSIAIGSSNENITEDCPMGCCTQSECCTASGECG